MKKKLFLVMIAVVMFIGAFNVYALTTSDEVSPSDPNSKMITDKAMLTVENGVENRFFAYKILNAYYNSSTNVVSYEFTDDFQTFLDQSSYSDFTVDDYFELTSGDITSGSTITTSTADRLMSSYATYIDENNPYGTLMNITGTTATATLVAGAYLVLSKSYSRNIYAVMLGNLDVTASNGSWVVNNETIVAKRSEPDFTLNVGDESDVFDIYEGIMPLLSFSISEKFPFEIVGQVPQFPTNANESNKYYGFDVYFYDEVVLEGDLSSIIVKDGDTTLTTTPEGIVTNANGKQVATITIDEESEAETKILRISFDTDYLINQEVTVIGEASLTDQALIGELNSLVVRLRYSTRPYDSHDHILSTTTGVPLYTFGMNVLKYDATDATPLDTPLANAVFDIYSDEDLQNKVGSVTTGEDGIGNFNGLKYGTYYLKETKAPTGYQLLEDPIEVSVGTDRVDGEAGDPPSYSVATAYAPNRKVGILPVTGGAGIILFTCIGVPIIGSGVGLLVYYKKKEQNIEVI